MQRFATGNAGADAPFTSTPSQRSINQPRIVPAAIGRYLGASSIASLPLVGRLMNKVDVRLLVAVSLSIGGLSLLLMTNFYPGISFKVLVLAQVVQAVSLAFLFVPLNTMAFRGIPPVKTNSASALINLACNFSGSIGISFASTLITRREQLHQSRLVETLRPLHSPHPDYALHVGRALGDTADSNTTLASICQNAVSQGTLLSTAHAASARWISLMRPCIGWPPKRA
jgi:MFS transporter, DHA2 family, multidrug resistance protein